MGDTISRAFRVIEYMAEQQDWVSLRAMSRELKMNEASLFRVLGSLKSLGYVRQDPQNSQYQLTLKIAGISAQLLGYVKLREISHPFLQGLTSSTNETTHLAILDGQEFVYIDKVDNTQAMEMRSRIGQRGMLHSTAAGKAILAHYPKSKLPAIIERLDFKLLTKHTLTDPGEFQEHLLQIRENGYALDNEENEIGIRCIGAPLFNHTGGVAGALSISGWTISMTPERMPELATELLQTCEEISYELGYRGKDKILLAEAAN